MVAFNPATPMNAPDKALPHVVTGLIAKRAELAGRIEHLQAQVRQATVELDHIEASIRIFAARYRHGDAGHKTVRLSIMPSRVRPRG